MAVSKAMAQAGYPPASSKNPQDLTQSKGWQELMAEYLPDEGLAQRHREQLNSWKHSKLYFDVDDDEETIRRVCDELGVKLVYVKLNKERDGQIAHIKAPDHFYRDLALDKAYKLKGLYGAEAGVTNIQNNFFGVDFLRRARERNGQQAPADATEV